MVDQRIACLTTDASLILLFGDTGQRAKGAGSNAGRLHAVFHTLVTTIALDHLTIRMTISANTFNAGAVADGQIDEDAQLNSLTPLSFDDEEAEDDAGKPAETDKDKEK